MYAFPVWYTIIVTCVGFALGCLLTYTIGVVQGNYRALFPYISDTGAYPIENGFFVLVIAITCLQVIMILYIRYKDAYIHLKSRFQRVFNFIVLLSLQFYAIFLSLMGLSKHCQIDDSELYGKDILPRYTLVQLVHTQTISRI